MMAAVAANPYPGLPPFEERDSERFFGRDREIEDVLDRLAARRLLAVLGVSGCGKSSLVRAGVIPVLRLGMADDLPAHFRIHIITPGNGPIQALANALGAPSDWPRDSFSLVDVARSALAPGESLLLVVDQFEELFRFRAESLRLDGANEASLFVNLLLNAVDQREVPIYVLLTMRTDFLGECAQFRGLPEALNDCYYLTPRLTRLQQQEAIEQPAHDLGVDLDQFHHAFAEQQDAIGGTALVGAHARHDLAVRLDRHRHQRAEDAFLALEPVVEDRLGHAGGFDDLAHGRRVVALAREQADRRLEQALAYRQFRLLFHRGPPFTYRQVLTTGRS